MQRFNALVEWFDWFTEYKHDRVEPAAIIHWLTNAGLLAQADNLKAAAKDLGYQVENVVDTQPKCDLI